MPNIGDLGLASVSLNSTGFKYFSGGDGTGKITLVYATAVPSQIEITPISGIVDSITQTADGGFAYRVRAATAASGVQPYTLQITNKTTAKTVRVSGVVEVVAALESKTSVLLPGQITRVSLDGDVVEVQTPATFAPASAKISVARSVEGKVYNIAFSRDVSADDVKVKLPPGALGFDPYNLSASSQTGVIGSIAKALRKVEDFVMSAVAQAVGTAAPTLNTKPYSNGSDLIETGFGTTLFATNGLGQRMRSGAETQFVSLARGAQAGRIWDPQDFRPTSSNPASFVVPVLGTLELPSTEGLVYLSQADNKKPYELHTSILGDVRRFKWDGYEPVLFVHGFVPDIMDSGGEGTWGKFPLLAQKTPMPGTNNTLVPFEFHWNTNQSYRLAAVDLANSINEIQKLSGKKVHIVAHSFGGVLVRSVLQNLAKTDVSTAANNVASLMTLGTPHSGILPSVDTFQMPNGVAVSLPAGQDAKTFAACFQVSCFEMGIDMRWSTNEKSNLGLINSYAKAGMHAAVLRHEVGRLPAIRILSGIGLTVQGTTAETGDYLISFGGQRFLAQMGGESQATPNMPLLSDESMGVASVSEVILGLPVTARPGKPLASNPLPSRRMHGYFHSSFTGFLNQFASDGGAALNRGLMAAPDLDCDTPQICTHAGFAVFRELLNDKLNWSNLALAQDTSSPPQAFSVSNTQGLSQAAVQALQTNLQLAQSKGIIRGSRIEWNQLTPAEQLQALGRLSAVPDSERSANLKRSYADDFEALNAWVDTHLSQSLWSSTAKAVFWDRDSLKTWLSLVSSMGTSLKGELRIVYAPAAAAISSGNKLVTGTANANRAYSYLQLLKSHGPWLDFVKSCAAAAPAWIDNTNQIGKQELDLKTMGSLIADPMDCAIDAFGAGSGNAQLALFGKAVSGTIKVDTDGSTVTVAQVIASVVQAILDAAPSGSTWLEYVRGVADIALAIADTVKAGNDFADRADTTFLVDEANFRQAYERLSKALLAQRNQQLLYARSADYYQSSLAAIQTDPTDNFTVGQQIQFWVTQAVSTVRSVVWSFGAGIASAVANVTNGVSEKVSAVYSAAGVKEVTAVYKDVAGVVVGQSSQQISVGIASIAQLAVITQVVNNNEANPVSVANGGSTTDTTPVMVGTLSAQLPANALYSVRVYRNGEANLLGTAVVNGLTWSFDVNSPLPSGQNQLTARVERFDGVFGPMSAPYSINVQALGVGSVMPAQVTRSVATRLTISGDGLPTSGLSVIAPGSRNTCGAPTAASASGFAVDCSLYTIGQQPLQVWLGTRQIGSLTVTVTSNVTDVNWSSASTSGYGKASLRFGEMVTYRVSGVNLLADPVMGFAVERCGVSNTEVGTASSTERSFQCWLNNEAGAVAGNMSGVVKDSLNGQQLYNFTVPVQTAPLDVNASMVVSWDLASVGTAQQGRGTNPRTVAVNAGVEIEGFLSNPMFDVDVSDTGVRLFNFRGFTGANAVFDASSFNGLVLRVPSGANWRFASASLNSSNTVAGLTAARITSQSDRVAINLQGLGYAAGSVVQVDFVKAAVTVATVGRLPDTGITSNQCYQAGSDVLVSCTSAGALALNNQQDGMVGRDVVNPNSADGKLGFSYSTVGSYPLTDCVKDNITGLIWEGKPTTGYRAASNTYTNFDSTSGTQNDNGATPIAATSAQINATTNSVGFKNAVNAAGLCGANDWRLPTADEMQSLVDYGKASPGPTLDAAWFPNTPSRQFWTSSPTAGYSTGAWSVYFDFLDVNGWVRSNNIAVRLVRSGQ